MHVNFQYKYPFLLKTPPEKKTGKIDYAIDTYNVLLLNIYIYIIYRYIIFFIIISVYIKQ